MSNINTNGIAANYPVSGTTNSTQQMRDNFSTIKQALEVAKVEITNVEASSLLKMALPGKTLDNDMAGAPISNATIKGFRDATYNLGSGLSGTVEIDVSKGNVQRGVISDDVSLTFTNWAPTGTRCQVELQFSLSNPLATIEFPDSVVNVPRLENSNGRILSAAAGVTHLFVTLSTVDCGTTVRVYPLTRPSRTTQIQIRTPTRVGLPGDMIGACCTDGDYLYMCYAEYDGVANIWSRLAVNNVW